MHVYSVYSAEDSTTSLKSLHKENRPVSRASGGADGAFSSSGRRTREKNLTVQYSTCRRGYDRGEKKSTKNEERKNKDRTTLAWNEARKRGLSAPPLYFLLRIHSVIFFL